MVLKFYGNSHSPNVIRVALILREKKIPFQYVHVDLATGEHKKEPFISKFPSGQVPTIDDNGFCLADSRAISRYLESQYSSHSPKFIPDDVKEKSLFEQAAATEIQSFDANASTAVFEKIYKPLFHLGETNEAAYKTAIEKLNVALDRYEKTLSRWKYLAGNQITLADLFHLPFGSLLPKAGSNVLTDPKRPNVLRWWNELSTREQWIAVEGGKFESNA